MLVLGAAGLTILLALLPQAGHDQLWLLLAAQRMLAAHSASPYGPQVFESNPPLAIWLSALPAAGAGRFHLPVTLVAKAAVCLAAAGSAAGCIRLLRRLEPVFTRANVWFLVFSSVVLFGAVPARDFGQRDHLLTLLVLPYLVTAAFWLRRRQSLESARPIAPGVRLVIVVAAALGLALKPHQALIPVAVELLVLLCSRPRRPRLLEPAVLLLAALAYYAAIRLLAPTYLTEILPVLRDTYWAFGHLSLSELLAQSIQLQVLALTVFTLLFARRRRTAPGPAVLVLFAAGVAATCAFLLQGTGWYYQQLPAITFFALALALQLIEVAPGYQISYNLFAPSWLPAAALALTLLALSLAAWFSDFQRTPQGLIQPQLTPDPAFFATLPPGAAVATLTTSVDDTVPPAFRYHLTLAQRYPHLWMLPAILRNQPLSNQPSSNQPLGGRPPGMRAGLAPSHVLAPARLAELSALQRRFMDEDLMRWQPTLILVARCQDPAVHCQVLEDRHDDLLAFFLQDPAFARIFAHYRFLRSAGPYDAYLRDPSS